MSEIDQEIRVNTAQHEQVLSETSKNLTAGLIDLCVGQMNKVIECVRDKPNDPLSAERYIYNAEKLLNMAHKSYELGEQTRRNAFGMYQAKGAKKHEAA